MQRIDIKDLTAPELDILKQSTNASKKDLMPILNKIQVPPSLTVTKVNHVGAKLVAEEKPMTQEDIEEMMSSLKDYPEESSINKILKSREGISLAPENFDTNKTIIKESTNLRFFLDALSSQATLELNERKKAQAEVLKKPEDELNRLWNIDNIRAILNSTDVEKQKQDIRELMSVTSFKEEIIAHIRNATKDLNLDEHQQLAELVFENFLTDPKFKEITGIVRQNKIGETLYCDFTT